MTERARIERVVWAMYAKYQDCTCKSCLTPQIGNLLRRELAAVRGERDKAQASKKPR